MAARRTAAGLLVLVAWAVAPRPACGEEPPAPTYAELKVQHEEARKAKRWEDVRDLLPQLVAAAAKGQDPEEVKDVLSVLQLHLTYGKEPVRLAALAGLGDLARPGSSVLLRPFLVGDKGRRQPVAVRRAALEACAMIHDRGTHKILLDLVRVPSSKTEDLEMAQHAARVYRHFKGAKRRDRYDVWHDFLLVYQGLYDSNALYMSGSAQTWWGGLNGPMLETFNFLTDNKFRTLNECIEWWRDNKEKIRAADAKGDVK